MADNTSYGIGQYRSSNNYNYIIKPTPSSSDAQDGYDTEDNVLQAQSYTIGSNNYQEIMFRLPHYRGQPFIQYGRTFYVKLTVPQNSEYTSILNLKLCPQNSKKEIDTTRFQQIKRLVVPPTPEKDSDFSTIILYEINKNVRVQLACDEKERASNKVYIKDNKVFYCSNASLKLDEDTDITNTSSIHTLIQDWKLKNKTNSTITFDFIFSPKYNLTEGYSYLLLEMDRTDAFQQSIQYIENGNTYHGIKMDPSSVKLELYAISNLLEGGSTGTSQIQSGSNSLTHIAVWGHPGQLLAINGEEIRIGQNGFYELDDFTINQLGVVVMDKNSDKFTIDYEYRINN